MITKINAKLNSDKNLKEILSGSIITFLLKMCGMLLGYLLVIYISKQYGAEGMGLYSLTLSVIAFLAMLSGMGMNISILRYVGQFTKENNDQKLKLLYRYVMEISIPISIVLSMVLFLLSEYIAVHIFHDIRYHRTLEVASFVIPFFSITNLNIEYIRGLKKLRVSEFIRSVSRPIVNLILLLIISLYFIDINLPIYTLAISLFANFCISMYFILKKIGPIQVKLKNSFKKKDLIETSFPMLLTVFSSFLISNVAVFFLQVFSTTTQVGIYSVSLKIALLISLVLMVINTISAPKFSELYWSKDYKALQKVISQSTKIIFIVSLHMAAIVAIFNKPILGLFGDEFIAGSTALLLLIIGQVVNAATGSTGVFLNMTGNQKVLRNIIVATMFASILLGYVLIPVYGINGAAFTSMTSAILANITSTYYVRKKLGYTTFFVPLFLRKLND